MNHNIKSKTPTGGGELILKIEFIPESDLDETNLRDLHSGKADDLLRHRMDQYINRIIKPYTLVGTIEQTKNSITIRVFDESYNPLG